MQIYDKIILTFHLTKFRTFRQLSRNKLFNLNNKCEYINKFSQEYLSLLLTIRGSTTLQNYPKLRWWWTFSYQALHRLRLLSRKALILTRTDNAFVRKHFSRSAESGCVANLGFPCSNEPVVARWRCCRVRSGSGRPGSRAAWSSWCRLWRPVINIKTT
jgi:hypothetical protein